MQLRSLSAASKLINPGDTVFVHGTATEPRALIDHWLNDPDCLAGVQLFSSFVPGVNNVNLAGLASELKIIASMNQTAYADAERQGQITALREPYSEVRRTLSTLPRLDLAFIQVAPDEGDGFSTGITGELIPTALRHAKKVCVIVNEKMSVPASGIRIPQSAVDFEVHVSAPLVEYAVGAQAPDPIANRIAALVASLIVDGDTLQAGIGAVPSALFAALSRHRELRVYSGMISDSFASLYESGALANDTEHVYGMALGSDAFYRWLSARRGCRVAGVEETHDRARIAAIDNFVAVNSAISVGLDGYVNAERIGSRCVSGPGGLPDYAVGASGAKGGRSIIALPAANSKKTVSRIVPQITDRAAQTLSPGQVSHVVTEHGIADLTTDNPEVRASRLLAIAEPGFRNELEAALG